MARFCGKCGSPLNENGQCPICQPAAEPPVTQFANSYDAPQPAPPAQSFQPAQAYPPMQDYHSSQAYPPVQDHQPPKAKKKGGKLKIIIPIIAGALLVIGALVFCAFWFHWFGLGQSAAAVTSQSQAFMKTSHGKIIGKINIDAVGEQPTTEDDCRIPDVGLYSQRLAQDGDAFYGINLDDYSKWVKITVNGKTTAEISDWYSAEALNNSILGDESLHLLYDLGNFTACGDDVILRVIGNPNYITAHFEQTYRLVRASKDGKKELAYIGDESVRAVEFIAYDGWIYYVDNGYRFGKETKPYCDSSQAGIYKIKPDGSEKTRIFDRFTTTKDRDYASSAAGLTVWQNKLYFCDLSDDSSRIACIGLDGSGYEQLTSEGALALTVDTDHNKIYFIEGKYNQFSSEDKALFELDLNSRQTRKIKQGFYNSYYYFSYDNGCLYFYNPILRFETAYVRLNLENNKWERVLYTPPVEVDEEDETGVTIHKTVSGGTYQWADLDDDKL